MKEVKVSIKKLEEKINEHQNKINALKSDIQKLTKNKLILCEHCGQRTRLDKLIFVQNHWYEEPYSCAGGDHWWRSDDNSYFICPKCESENRMYRRQDIKLLLENKHLFKAIWRRHNYGYPTGVKITKPGDENY